jgi:hypothetical protein
MATRKSTPKYLVHHLLTGVIVLAGVSRTEARHFAVSMDEGRKGKPRFAVAPDSTPKTRAA